MALSRIYRAVIPEPVRNLRWKVRNAVGLVFGDKQPTVLSLNYEGYWERKEAEGQLWLSYREIVDICDAIIPSGSTVLDIGCGNGAFLQRLKQRKTLHELGVDISRKAVELTIANGVNARVLNVIEDDLSELGQFDYICAFEVLEHLQFPEEILVHVREHAKHVLVSIPNTGNFLSRLRLLFGRFPRQWIQHPGEHVRYWTVRDFELTAALCKYKVKNVAPIRGWRGMARFSPSLFAEALLFELEPL